MKAIVYQKYGSPDVLELREVEKPAPGVGEVLVKVYATAVNYADFALLTGKPFLVRLMAGGLLNPKNQILGADVAGRVEAVGSGVRQFQPGDEVFGDISGCGLGGLAEYVSVPENVLVSKPANITFEQAAAVPMAAVTALQGLRNKGQIQTGQKVLINGASGGVGTFAVQIAKSFGAEVTAVCSTGKMNMVRSIGADHVVDYTQENFTQNGRCYDLILAANGYHPISDYKQALNPQGTYVCTGGTMPQIFQSILLGPLMSMSGNKKVGNLAAKPDQKDLAFMKELLEVGKVVPVIDRCYPLNETAEALRYLGEGHAKGKVVITVAQNTV
jgi:NADPH:quinone reductase-like Zn-dependent oxidoreductase